MKKLVIPKCIRLTDGARGQGIAFNRITGNSFALNADDYNILRTIAKQGFSDESDFVAHTGLGEGEFEKCLDKMISQGLVEYEEVDSSKIKHSAKENWLTALASRKVEKYKYKIGDAENIKGLNLWAAKNSWRKLGLSIFPLMLVIGILEIYGFYFSGVRPLGRIIANDIFYTPTIYEAFVVFTFTNLLTILYKIAVGRGRPYGGSALYMKLLAGFNPVFETDDDKQFAKELGCTKIEYLYYIASPTILRLYMMMLGILIISLAYPFGTSLERSVLSTALTTINISIMALTWQAIPSPGTLSVKALEILGIIPQRFLGLSVRRAWTAYRARGHRMSKKASKQLIGSGIFLIISVALLLFKTAFLGFWVLPQISIGVPQFLGQWTSQIVVAALGVLALKYMVYSYNPIKHKVQGREAELTDSAKFDEVDHVEQSLSHGKLNRAAEYLKKKAIFVVVLLLLFPFNATVSGSAKVQENMSLDISSSEKESAVITNVLVTAPSATVVKKGTLMIELRSNGLDLALKKSDESLKALESEKSILEVTLRSVSEGGSRYESSKNKTEDVVINYAEERAFRKELSSLSRQKELLKKQVSTYKRLSEIGAMSTLQYEDKLIDYEEIGVRYTNALSNLEGAVASASKARNDQKVEQILKIKEDKISTEEELGKVTASIAKERSNLEDLHKRKKALIIKAPFDCVVNSDTSVLMNKAISYGDQILSIKAIPTERIIVSVPEYNRNEIVVGDNVEVRLYSRVMTQNGGHLFGKVESLSPISSTEYDQEKLEIIVNIRDSLKNSMIGATGTAKVRVGFTCILVNILKPLVRFVEVDVWQYLP